MEIKEIQIKIRNEEYEISFHAEKERYAEDISIPDIEKAIVHGEILEDYPNDTRGSSCLVLAYLENRSIHLVCGYSDKGWIRIITVYIPKLPKWLDERTRATGGKKNA
ncbi:MAG: DUF4258 domain-containing protein [Elusimicrobiota bacterium]